MNRFLLEKPVPMKGPERAAPARIHPTAGSPEQWLEGCTVTFDFFVDWSCGRVQPDLWLKRLIQPGVNRTPPALPELLDALRRVDGDLERYRRFALNHGFSPSCILFDDTQDWNDENALLYRLELLPHGEELISLTLGQIKQEINRLSGGTVRIGSKGLKISTSRLESALACTSSLWPGDADGILLKKGTDEPLAVLEYRKHTLSGSPTSVKRYYDSGADKRKYDRICLLRDRISPRIPVVVITYPIRAEESDVLFEKIQAGVSRRQLTVEDSRHCMLEAGKMDISRFKHTLNSLL